MFHSGLWGAWQYLTHIQTHTRTHSHTHVRTPHTHTRKTHHTHSPASAFILGKRFTIFCAVEVDDLTFKFKQREEKIMMNYSSRPDEWTELCEVSLVLQLVFGHFFKGNIFHHIDKYQLRSTITNPFSILRDKKNGR